VGYHAGRSNQGTYTTAVGSTAGQEAQGDAAVAVGNSAGATSQGGNSTAMGNSAGKLSQGAGSVAVGVLAGGSNQGTYAQAIGYQAGETGQGTETVAVGNGAGMSAQGAFSTAVGSLAGKVSQGIVATAIGRAAGLTSQGAFAVAIGYRAGFSEQAAHSIILNGTNAALNTTTASSFHVKPVRGGNMTASALSYTADGEIVEQTNIHFDGSGNLGIGTAAPASTMHIYKDANERTTGLIIEKENAGTGAAAIFFAVSSANSPEPASLAKGAILFQRESTYGRGSLKLCVDTVGDTNAVTSTESALTITYQGFVQPGQINLTLTGATRALGGNYLFQGVYNAYRTNGYASTTWSTVYEKNLQVVRMGSLLSIRGNLPLKLTSSTMNLQFTWAEVGCDGQRGGLSTLVNQCTSTTGTWNTVTGNATYLILPSTGHAGNNTVDYNDIVYLIDLGYITAY